MIHLLLSHRQFHIPTHMTFTSKHLFLLSALFLECRSCYGFLQNLLLQCTHTMSCPEVRTVLVSGNKRLLVFLNTHELQSVNKATKTDTPQRRGGV